MILYILIKKQKQYLNNINKNLHRKKLSVWYDCEHNEFVNI